MNMRQSDKNKDKHSFSPVYNKPEEHQDKQIDRYNAVSNSDEKSGSALEIIWQYWTRIAPITTSPLTGLHSSSASKVATLL